MAVFMIIVLLVIHRWLLSWGQNLKNMISMHIVPLIINCINVWTHHRALNLILETRVYWFVFEFNDFLFFRSRSPWSCASWSHLRYRCRSPSSPRSPWRRQICKKLINKKKQLLKNNYVFKDISLSNSFKAASDFSISILGMT